MRHFLDFLKQPPGKPSLEWCIASCIISGWQHHAINKTVIVVLSRDQLETFPLTWNACNIKITAPNTLPHPCCFSSPEEKTVAGTGVWKEFWLEDQESDVRSLLNPLDRLVIGFTRRAPSMSLCGNSARWTPAAVSDLLLRHLIATTTTTKLVRTLEQWKGSHFDYLPNSAP